MMRGPKAEPPPKGKVRQLYPPPEFDEEYPDANVSGPTTIDSERPMESIFVSGAEELEERRRLARERSEARRNDESRAREPEREELAPMETPVIRPPFGGPFDDEEA